jgi:hypothetical protein
MACSGTALLCFALLGFLREEEKARELFAKKASAWL